MDGPLHHTRRSASTAQPPAATGRRDPAAAIATPGAPATPGAAVAAAMPRFDRTARRRAAAATSPMMTIAGASTCGIRMSSRKSRSHAQSLRSSSQLAHSTTITGVAGARPPATSAPAMRGSVAAAM
jgi:hypothetical protein